MEIVFLTRLLLVTELMTLTAVVLLAQPVLTTKAQLLATPLEEPASVEESPTAPMLVLTTPTLPTQLIQESTAI